MHAEQPTLVLGFPLTYLAAVATFTRSFRAGFQASTPRVRPPRQDYRLDGTADGSASSRTQTRGVDAYGATAAFLSGAALRLRVLAAPLICLPLLLSGCTSARRIVYVHVYDDPAGALEDVRRVHQVPVAAPAPVQTPAPAPTPQVIRVSASVSISVSSVLNFPRPANGEPITVYARHEEPVSRPAERVSTAPASYARPVDPPPSRPSSVPVTSRFVHAALSQVGRPYVYGAGGPDSFDCSGLVSYAARAAGLDIGRVTSSDLASMGSPVSSLEPGDILVKPGHVGVYVGGGRFVHASSSSGRVVIAAYDPSFFTSARRIGGLR